MDVNVELLRAVANGKAIYDGSMAWDESGEFPRMVHRDMDVLTRLGFVSARLGERVPGGHLYLLTAEGQRVLDAAE